MTHYNAAVSSWNTAFIDDPLQPVGQNDAALVHVVQAGSFDEAVIDAIMVADGFSVQNTCIGQYGSGPGIWGGVLIYSGKNELNGEYGNHKVCVFTANTPDSTNWQGFNYRYLTIKHEIGHVLSLGG